VASSLQVTSKKRGKALVVAITGDAGMAFVGQLQHELSRVCEAGPERVVVDLSGLTFISSMGMGTLVNFRKGVERCGGTVRIAALQPLLAEAFRRARMTEVFETFDTVEAALAKKAAAAEAPAGAAKSADPSPAAGKSKGAKKSRN
jgi:anti-sigma B factor antagonist